MKKKSEYQTIKGYKVFNSDFKCRDFQFAENTEYKHKGEISICTSGFHFCILAADCFSYYDFNPNNIVCEVEARGKTATHSEDSKVVTDLLFIGRKLSWQEVLVVANSGANNTGLKNSGYRNSGYRNSGYRNSGDKNSGDWNSGYRNSGDRNSGDSNSGYRNSGNWNSGDRNSGNWNSGDRNSGNWNSGDRNSGDSNSGYRNSGAFCLNPNPTLYLFDKPCKKMTVKEWENTDAYNMMYNIENTIWINASMMTDEEKAAHPHWETTEGYLKTIPMKEAWKQFWDNLMDEKRKVFTSLENFNAESFYQITGIKV